MTTTPTHFVTAFPSLKPEFSPMCQPNTVPSDDDPRQGPLTDRQRKDFAEFETTIRQNEEQTSIALEEIERRKLYREKYTNFDEYCMKKWGFSDNTGRRKAQLVRFNRDCEAEGLPPANQDVWMTCKHGWSKPIEAYRLGLEAGCKTARDFRRFILFHFKPAKVTKHHEGTLNEPLTKIHLTVFSSRDVKIIQQWEDWRLVSKKKHNKKVFIFRKSIPTAIQHHFVGLLVNDLHEARIEEVELRTQL